MQQGTLGIQFLTWKSYGKGWPGRATLLTCKQSSRQQSQQAQLGRNLLALKTGGTVETEREVSLPVFRQQVTAVRLNGAVPVFLYIWRIWVSMVSFLAFHFECKRENNNNKTLLLVWEGGKAGIVFLNTNAFIWAQMEHTIVNVKYHQIMKIRPGPSSQLI